MNKVKILSMTEWSWISFKLSMAFSYVFEFVLVVVGASVGAVKYYVTGEITWYGAFETFIYSAVGAISCLLINAVWKWCKKKLFK